jgi:hypothetical protein
MQENNPFEVDDKRPKKPTRETFGSSDDKTAPIEEPPVEDKPKIEDKSETNDNAKPGDDLLSSINSATNPVHEEKAEKKAKDESKSKLFGLLRRKKGANEQPAPQQLANIEPPQEQPQPTVNAPLYADYQNFVPSQSPTPVAEQPAFQPPVNPQPKFKKSKDKKKAQVAIDGVSPEYANGKVPSKAEKAANQVQQQPSYIPEYQQPVAPQPVYEQPYEAYDPIYQQQPQQQPVYQQPQQYPMDYPVDSYANPLVSNQPLPVNHYTTPNIYDPYDPYATMVDLNPTAPNPNKKPDWRFVATLGAGIVCLAGLIFFWIMWGQASASLNDAVLQVEDLTTKSQTGEKAANQLQDMQSTIRDLNTKIETLQDKNDALTKDADKVKDLEDQITTLKKDKETLNDKLTELLLKSNSSATTTP